MTSFLPNSFNSWTGLDATLGWTLFSLDECPIVVSNPLRGGGVRRLSNGGSQLRDNEREGAPELLHLLSLPTEDASDMVHDFAEDSSSVKVRLVVVEVEGWLELAPSTTLSTTSPKGCLCSLLRSNDE